MRKLLTVMLAFALATSALFSFKETPRIIVIDAGHGGNDKGANQDGINEKDLVLNIAKQIENQNKNSDVKIYLTRESDTAPTLSDRTDYINSLKPEMVLSLHVNRSPKPERKGAEIYTQSSEISRKMGQNLASKFDNCPVKETNLYILRNSESPAVLMELGFISNPEDLAYLSSEAGQKEISKKITEFIKEN